MQANEQYFHVVVFIILYKVVLTCKAMNETLVYAYINIIKSDLNFFILFQQYS